MNIVVSIFVSEGLQEGGHPMMSDFTDKESVRLKQALAHRNLQNQNSANEYQIKTTQGPTL